MGHLDWEALSLLADEMVEGRTSEEYHRHIASCPVCEQAYDDVVAMSFAMTKLEAVTPPAGFEAFTQGIMANLPPQDPVSKENAVEIKEHRGKRNVFAELHWQQVVGYGAMVAVLASMFLPRQEPLDTVTPLGVAEYSLSTAAETAEEELPVGGEMMIREMEQPVADTDAVSMATPESVVAETYSPEEIALAMESLRYYREDGVDYLEELVLDVVELVLELREVSEEDFWPVVLHLKEEITELDGTWGQWQDLTFTTRSYGEISPYLSRFSQTVPVETEDYMLVVVG